LRVLSEHFSEISSYPCKQYFDLFCELIDQNFAVKKVSNVVG
jgi:ubiquitin carboxyl-terminal hydrolase 34